MGPGRPGGTMTQSRLLGGPRHARHPTLPGCSGAQKSRDLGRTESSFLLNPLSTGGETESQRGPWAGHSCRPELSQPSTVYTGQRLLFLGPAAVQLLCLHDSVPHSRLPWEVGIAILEGSCGMHGSRCVAAWDSVHALPSRPHCPQWSPDLTFTTVVQRGYLFPLYRWGN